MRNNEERLGANMARQDPFVPQIPQASDASAAPLSFIVPTEHVILPSGGKFYPEHHPLHGKDSIEIKQMTAKEEDILTSKNLLKKGVALDKLIQSLVVDKSINTDTLTIEDRNAIIISARISAYGSEYITTVSCPECQQKAKFAFDLNEKIEKQEESNIDEQYQYTLNLDGTFETILPLTKWKIKCRVMNGYDEKAIIKLSDARKNSNTNDSLLLEQLKMTIVELQGFSINDKKELIFTAIESMPAKDSKYLRSLYEKVIKPLDMTKTFNCSNCDTKSTLEVPLTADFFWFK